MSALTKLRNGAASAWAGPAKLYIIAALAIAVLVLVCLTVLKVVNLSRDLAKSQSATTTAVAANLQWEAAAAQSRADLASCQSQWSNTTQRGAAAIAEARKTRLQAQLEFDSWMRPWDLRGDTCAAALVNMEDACASSLSQY